MSFALKQAARSSPPSAALLLPQFRPTHTPPKLLWSPVVGGSDTFKLLTEVFERTLQPLYGSQGAALSKIASGKDRTCYLLFDNDEAVGVLVYKNAPSNEFQKFGIVNSLEVKSLFLIDPEKHSGRGLGSVLLDKVITAAKALQMQSIHVTVSEKAQGSHEFFSKKQFQVIKTFDSLYQKGVKEYLFQLILPKKESKGSSLEKAKLVSKEASSSSSSKRKQPDFSERSSSSSSSSQLQLGSVEGGSSPIVKKGKTSASSSSSSSQQSGSQEASSNDVDIASVRFRGIRIKKIYLEMIQKGTKTAEGRIHKGIFKTFKPGDGISFFNGKDFRVRCLVTRVNVYKSFEEMLATENFKSLVPTAASSADALKAYHKIPGYLAKSGEYGVVTFHLQKV